MSNSWDELASEYLKIEEALEISWGEIEQLEQVNSEQQREIAFLRALLESCRTCGENPVAAKFGDSSTFNSSCSSIDFGNSFCCEMMESCSSEIEIVREGSIVVELERKAQQVEIENLKVQLVEKDKLEIEMEKMKKEVQNLKSDNSFLEKNLIDLQSQLATYMLQETSNSSSRRLKSQETEAKADDLRKMLLCRDSRIEELEMQLISLKHSLQSKKDKARKHTKRLESAIQEREEQMMHLQAQSAAYMLNEALPLEGPRYVSSPLSTTTLIPRR